MIVLIISWYLIGLVTCLLHCYFIENEITLKDLLLSLTVGGIAGPMAIMCSFLTYNKFDNIIILSRKNK